MTKLTAEMKCALRARGVETFHSPGASDISHDAAFEPPCSIKWMNVYDQVRIAAFSYAVSGHFSRVTIGRYCSIGEQVQIGRSNHDLNWVSTSPFFNSRTQLFGIGQEFEEASSFHSYAAPNRQRTTRPPGVVTLGNDVWIGHGAFILPGVTIGSGAVVGAMSVVTKDVPPYAIAAGNPAEVRRMRLPEELATQLQVLGWWQFAPWQLVDVDFSLPEIAIEQLRLLIPKLQPYAPRWVVLPEL